eukprot:g749.t1
MTDGNAGTSALRIDIPRYKEVRGAGSAYIAYVIEVRIQSGGIGDSHEMHWEVQRRYSELAEFKKRISDHLAPGMRFPGKTMSSRANPGQVQKRLVALRAFFKALFSNTMPMTMQREVFELLDVRKQGGRTSEVFWRALKQMGHGSPSASVLVQSEKWRYESVQKAASIASPVASAAQPAGSAVTPASRSSTVDGARDDNRSTTPSGSGSPAPHTTTLSQRLGAVTSTVGAGLGGLLLLRAALPFFSCALAFVLGVLSIVVPAEGEGRRVALRAMAHIPVVEPLAEWFCPGTSVSQLRLDV